MSIFLKTGRVRSEWTDYNGHMNLAYYIHLFDGAWEILLGKFNIGEEAAKNEKRTTFAVESHTTYDQELNVGDEVDLNLLFLDIKIICHPFSINIVTKLLGSFIF